MTKSCSSKQNPRTTKVIVRYPNLSGAIVEIAWSTDPDSTLFPVLFGAQCTGCLDLPRSMFRRRIKPVRRWAAHHAATCRALPQPDTDHQ